LSAFRGTEPLEQRVYRFIRDNHLLQGQKKLVAAVSGGADSVCLLHILSELRGELGISLHAAHLNHLLRGEDSEADARYVAELCRRMDIPCTVEQYDVKAYQSQRRLSPEEAAREVRYAFLARVAEENGTDRVAVGHTENDQVETILMHLVRGTGTKGLRGLQPASLWQLHGKRVTVIRPLLTVSRKETEEYCLQNQLTTRLDASNLSLSPLRNRVRHQLLPLLRGYNPLAGQALLRTARIVAEDIAFLETEAAVLWDKIATMRENTIILDTEKFRNTPSAMQRYLLRLSIEKLLGDLKDIEERHIEELLEALDKQAGKRITLPGGLVFSVEYGRYLLGFDPAALSPFPVLEEEVPLKVPGETSINGWKINTVVVDRTQMPENRDNFTAFFNLDATGGRITVRARRNGDRFQPLGMEFTKKLKEFMIDSKIPSAWRDRVPLVCSPRHILWVAGWRIDERAKVTDSTREVLRISFEKIP